GERVVDRRRILGDDVGRGRDVIRDHHEVIAERLCERRPARHRLRAHARPPVQEVHADFHVSRWRRRDRRRTSSSGRWHSWQPPLYAALLWSRWLSASSITSTAPTSRSASCTSSGSSSSKLRKPRDSGRTTWPNTTPRAWAWRPRPESSWPPSRSARGGSG